MLEGKEVRSGYGEKRPMHALWNNM